MLGNINFKINRCRLAKTCFPYYSYMLINPSSQLILDALCKEGCQPGDSIEYSYKVSSGNLTGSLDLVWFPFVDSQGIFPSIFLFILFLILKKNVELYTCFGV